MAHNTPLFFHPDGSDAATEARLDFWAHLSNAITVWLECSTDKRLAPLIADLIEVWGYHIEDKDPDAECWLYRLFTDRDRLLYVGITKNLPARVSAHKSRFGSLLDHWTYEPHPTRESALRAEALAIATEYPAFNIDHPEAAQI